MIYKYQYAFQIDENAEPIAWADATSYTEPKPSRYIRNMRVFDEETTEAVYNRNVEIDNLGKQLDENDKTIKALDEEINRLRAKIIDLETINKRQRDLLEDVDAIFNWSALRTRIIELVRQQQQPGE